MAVANFKQTIWSAKIQHQLETITSLKNHCDFEFEGEAKFYSSGHYEDSSIKWKGKPMYLIEGNRRCQFIDNLKEEKKIYDKFAIF